VVLPRHSSARVTPTVAKAAAGAIEHLPIATVPGIPGALTALSRAGVWSVGLDASAPRGLWGLEVADRPLALVLGSEGKGLSRLARARCDLLACIPRAGNLESLNVSAAAAVALLEVSRARSETFPT
jgi:23S rRNA (guanosine2251-2'-O)-methyltransferase